MSASKFTIATLALFGLINAVQMQLSPNGQMQPAGPLSALNGLTGGLTNALSGGQNQGAGPLGGLNGLTNGLMGANNPLGGLLGGQQGQMQQQPMMMGQQNYMNPLGQQGMVNTPNGLMETVRQLLQNVMNGVRNLVAPGNNGFGRNNGANMMMPRNPLQNQMMNGQQQQPMYGQQQPGNSLLPDLNGLTAPITNALSQGRLPDVNRLTSTLGQTVNNLGQGLTGGLTNPMMNRGQQQQQLQPQPQQQQPQQQQPQQQPLQQQANGPAPSA